MVTLASDSAAAAGATPSSRSEVIGGSVQIYAESDGYVSEFLKAKYEREARKFWDLFYKRNGERFFKDRHYLHHEWGRYLRQEILEGSHLPTKSTMEESVVLSAAEAEQEGEEQQQNAAEAEQEGEEQQQNAAEAEQEGEEQQQNAAEALSSEATGSERERSGWKETSKEGRDAETATGNCSSISSSGGFNMTKTVLEVGCGAGNTIFPLLEENQHLFVHACDFSERAVSLVKAHPSFSSSRLNAFVCDLTADDLTCHVPAGSVDAVTAVFVLSAISPEKMPSAIDNIKKVLKPTGVVLFRDYAAGDLAEQRLQQKEQKISDNFFVRGDGTRAFYFSEAFLCSLFASCGFRCVKVFVHNRVVENRARELQMKRRWLQAVFELAGNDKIADVAKRDKFADVSERDKFADVAERDEVVQVAERVKMAAVGLGRTTISGSDALEVNQTCSSSPAKEGVENLSPAEAADEGGERQQAAATSQGEGLEHEGDEGAAGSSRLQMDEGACIVAKQEEHLNEQHDEAEEPNSQQLAELLGSELSLSTLAALNEFLAERAGVHEGENHMGWLDETNQGGSEGEQGTLEVGENEDDLTRGAAGVGRGGLAFSEDWGMSQFWYDDATSAAVAEEVLLLTRGGQLAAACLACPSLFQKLKNLKPASNMRLFEFDRRFGSFGEQFTFYDYAHPQNIPAELHAKFDVVIADPPYLSQECFEKTAIAMKLLRRNELCPLLLLTGWVQKERAKKTLNMQPCTFRPQHKSKLANEFLLYTNYNPNDRLGGWEDESIA